MVRYKEILLNYSFFIYLFTGERVPEAMVEEELKAYTSSTTAAILSIQTAFYITCFVTSLLTQ